jgi:hypothetical protein
VCVAGVLISRGSRFAPPVSDSALAEETSRINSNASRPSRRVTALDPVRESTPNGDMRDVSTMLKPPSTPHESTPATTTREHPLSTRQPATPSRLPPLPDSPMKSVLDVSRREAEVFVDMIKRK